MDLLARREHSRQELQQKLVSRGFDDALIDTVIDQLAAENLQSDDRFTEAYVNERSGKGFGPLYIRQALRSRGIDDHLIAQYLDPNDPEWTRLAAHVGEQRFGVIESGDRQTYAKAVRFLQQRGFSGEQVRRALQGLDDWD
ncbi:regulatory protein [Methylohalomonas lacus]|uniref:Regulatory protein RecX n=1 Tax=Methylohalomonas lacus TaxID=398773 RepID=A0AAE3HIS0_9GAMM|nr:regulatory protein RecX [Methylohalomonas lacus]MCS3903124.1 regulatory protein [Methylohalomonas lacus]